ncbi:hypothetical protein LCGC14_1654720, partial [marine sediment metagenome]
MQALDPGLIEGVETPGVLQRIADGMNTLGFRLTALQNFSQIAERAGHGAPFSRIAQPVDEALKMVGVGMGVTRRTLLGGKTFNDQLKVIRNIAQKVPKDRHAAIRGLQETLSRKEILATRGIVEGKKGMTVVERQTARIVEGAGLRDHIPRLIALTRSARALEKGKKAFLKRSSDLRKGQELAPEVEEQLARLTEMAEKEVPETFEGILDFYGASKEEKMVIALLENNSKLPKDEFSSFVVSRYLVAPELKPGFKSVREQFIAENSMVPREVKVTEEVERMVNAVFAESGMDGKRQIAGFWSHARTWVESGVIPDEHLVPKRSIEWSANRFRSGELNIYETDPVHMANKLARNMLMKRHLDPVLKTANKELKRIRRIDTKTHRVMGEYLSEVSGGQHASFDRIDETIRSFMSVTGLDQASAKGLSSKVTNVLAGLAYSAAIPFRAALILRNYFQMVQFTPPRIGFKYFYEGLKRAMTPEGYREALERGVIPVDVVPLHAATEILPQEIAKALGPFALKYRQVFDAGFRWYRKADDLGRAVAYHGVQARINRYLPEYMGGKINWETFKSRAKINTFDSNEVAEYTRLFKDGQIDEAGKYLGGRLAGDAQFRYGGANHPAGWGSIYGRLFGQFGTWPVQYKDYLVKGLTRGSAK